MGADDPVEVAGELVDPEHRLPGEEEAETSTLVEDAVHWLHVYDELLSFKRTLLKTAEVHKEDTADAVAHEISSDQVVLETELRRLEQRHQFWQERLRQLHG